MRHTLPVLALLPALVSGQVGVVGSQTARVASAIARSSTSRPGSPGKVTIPLGPWTASGAVAFAQRPDRRIVGARVLPR